MKTLRSLLFWVAIATAAPAGAGELRPLRVAAGSEDLQGLRLLLDGKFVGVVGDIVMLAPTHHHLAVELPWGLTVNYALTRQGKRIVATEIPGNVCVGRTSWTIEQTAQSVSQDGAVPLLKLAPPGVRFEGICPVDLPNLQCMSAVTQLRIGSTPEVGAEIWVDGVRLAAETSRTVVVNYCEGTAPAIDVLLRKPGYVPCTVRIDFATRLDLREANCALRKLES